MPPPRTRRPIPPPGGPSYLGDLTYWCACNSSLSFAANKIEKRLSNNLSFLTAYTTYGKSIDEDFPGFARVRQWRRRPQSDPS
jgi:hypothetical protein